MTRDPGYIHLFFRRRLGRRQIEEPNMQLRRRHKVRQMNLKMIRIDLLHLAVPRRAKADQSMPLFHAWALKDQGKVLNGTLPGIGGSEDKVHPVRIRGTCHEFLVFRLSLQYSLVKQSLERTQKRAVCAKPCEQLSSIRVVGAVACAELGKGILHGGKGNLCESLGGRVLMPDVND